MWKENRFYILIKKNYLILVLLLGFLLRLYNLSYQSVWFDEAFTIYHSQQSIAHIFGLNDTSPPLYYLVLHFWIQFTGISEFSTRLLSVFFGSLSIFIAYLLGLHIFNKKTGLYVALFLAISPSHVYYSQETRPYVLLFLFTLLSMYFYLKLGDNFSKRAIFSYLVSSVLLIYSHLYGLLILLVQNVHQLSTNRHSKLKSWLLLQAIILIFYIPWLLQLPQIISKGLHSWIQKPSLVDLASLHYKFLAGEVFSFPGWLLMLVYTFMVLKYFYKPKRLVFLLSWILIPILVPYAYSLVFTPIFTAKYVVIASLPLYLISGYSFFCMKKHTRIIIFMLIMILSGFTLNLQYNTITKDSWKEVSRFIQSNMHEGDKMLIIAPYEVLPLAYYFEPNCFKNIDIYRCLYLRSVYGVESVEQISEFNGEYVWLILSRDQNVKNVKEILTTIHDRFDTVMSKEYLLNTNSLSSNKFYQFLDERGLLYRKFNKVQVKYLTKKEKRT